MFRNLIMATRKQTIASKSLLNVAPMRLFSSQVPPSFSDIGDVMKTNYTEEYDQGLDEEAKN
jgi:succinate dehydrogenase (ubiquinone) iron-sulfur subunit